jgi:imidazolonepropionase-like amidohydrolase
MPSRAALAAIVSCLVALPLAARDAPPRRERATPIAYVHAHLIPIAGPEIDDGVLVVRGAHIDAVGTASDIRVPSDAVIVDLTGRTVMPGLVDTHSHVGGGWGADGSAPIQPDVRVWDSIDCRNPGLQRAQAGGITTLNIMSGSGHLMSGQTAYLKNKDANTIEEMMVRGEDGEPLGGMKMANGTNSQGDAPFPGTRSKSAALVREQFVKAQAWMKKRDKPKKGEVVERDLAMEGLAEVLEGKRIVHFHTHRHDDIMTVLRLKEEFGFRLVLHHVSEGWKVADEIAKAGVPCSIIVLDAPGGKIEAKDLSLQTGGILERAGVKVAFHTDDWITDSRLFLRAGGLAVRGGMSREGALRALTINGAEMLDLGKRIGTLEKGKDADFLVLSGDPLSAFTQVLETWVEGEKVFDRSREKDRLWAEGGWGAGERRAFTGCCFADGGDR